MRHYFFFLRMPDGEGMYLYKLVPSNSTECLVPLPWLSLCRSKRRHETPKGWSKQLRG